MSDTSSEHYIEGDDGENLDRHDFDLTLFRDYRDFYKAGLHRERTPVHIALHSLFSSNTRRLYVFIHRHQYNTRPQLVYGEKYE